MNKIIRYFPLNRRVESKKIGTLGKLIGLYIVIWIAPYIVSGVLHGVPLIGNLFYWVFRVWEYYVIAGMLFACYQCFSGKDFSSVTYIGKEDFKRWWSYKQCKIAVIAAALVLALIPRNTHVNTTQTESTGQTSALAETKAEQEKTSAEPILGQNSDGTDANLDEDLGEAEEIIDKGTVVVSDEWNGLHWEISNTGFLSVTGVMDDTFEWNEWYWGADAPWGEYKEVITGAYISFTGVKSLSGFFADCRNLTSVDLSDLDTNSVSDMSYMFFNCNALEKLDVSNLDTGNVANMSGMFSLCSSLTELDVSGFDTGNVADMSLMFESCVSLADLDLSNFDTGSVTNMNMMFGECSSLTKLDLSGFDTGNVFDTRSMFSGCGSLIELDVSSFDTGNVNNMSSMFAGCRSLTNLDLSNFDMGKADWMSYMYSDCSNLEYLDLSNFDNEMVIEDNMFYGCNNPVVYVPSKMVSKFRSTFPDISVAAKDVSRNGEMNGQGSSETEEFDLNRELGQQITTVSTTISDIRYTIYENGAEIEGFKESSAVIPKEIEYKGVTYPVVCLGGVCEDWEEFTIPSHIKYISSGAFVISKIKKLEIPDTVEYMSAYQTFEGSHIEEISFSSNLKTDSSWNRTFADCKSLRKITIPNGVTKLEGTFNGCENLLSVQWPDNLEVIGRTAFLKCTALEELDIPESVTEISGGAFSYTLFNEIQLPEGLIYLDMSAFDKMSLLEEIIVPDSVTEYSSAFNVVKCPSLKKIKYSNNARFRVGPFAEHGNSAELNSLELIIFPDTLQDLDSEYFSGVRESNLTIQVPGDMVEYFTQKFPKTNVVAKE